MNHSPAYILSQYLINNSLLTNPGDSGDWKVYVGVLPDGNEVEDDAAASIDTTPVKDGRLMAGANIYYYGTQLLVRSSAYNTGYAKADALADALEGVDDEEITIGSDTYQINNVSALNGVVSLGLEEGTKRRELFSVNFLVTMKEI